MEDKQNVVKVIDKRHFLRDGTRRTDFVEEEPKNEVKKEVKENGKKTSVNQSDESFLELISFIVHNALAALGQIKGPLAKSEVNLTAATTMIEWLEAIERKSKGNLSSEEEKALRDSLYQLKILYIEARKGEK